MMSTAEDRLDRALDAIEGCEAAHPGGDRFAAALACVEQHLAGALGRSLRSLAVCGSAARGEADPLSDLDVWAIVSEPWSQFCFLRAHGVAIDLDLMAEAAATRETARTPYYRNVAAGARVVYDPDGIFAALRERLIGRPRPRDERTEAWCRLRPHAVIRDAADAIRRGDPDAGLLLDAALLEILALPGILDGVTARRPVRTLAFARRAFPAAAALIAELAAAPLECRPAILERLAEIVLEPAGGPLERYRSARRPAETSPKLQRAWSVL